MKYYIINLERLSDKECFRDASKEELRVLLTLISEKGEYEDADALARLSHTSRARAISSLAFWQDSGIILESDSPVIKDSSITEEYETDETPEKSATEIARSIKDKGLSALLSEIARLMERPMLSTSETKKIVTVYTDYALNEEYIITLAAFLKENGKLTVTKLVSDAERLAKKGLDCVEELEIYLAKRSKLSDAEWRYKRLIGIYERALSPIESEMAEKWYCVFGYTDEIIGYAFSITTSRKNKLEIHYMDAILTSWHENGCKTLEECEAAARKFSLEWQEENAKNDATKKTAGRKKQAEKPRYGEFNVEDAFAKALMRSYGSEENEEGD